MQKRSFQWKDNDYTDSINRHLLGVIPYGLYAGFDAVFADGLTLELNHNTTGVDEVTVPLVRTPKLGKVVTQQGATIQEDAAISVAITANGSGFARIDTIVIEHTYVANVGGTPAIYKTVEGSPASNPVPSDLPFPEKQVAIGYLYVPAGMTTLTAVGVSYTRAEIPTLGNNTKILRSDKVQVIEGRKQLLSVYGALNNANLQGGVMTFDKEGNYYILSAVDNSNYADLATITAKFEGNTNTLDVICGQRVKIVSGGNISVASPLYIEANEILRVMFLNGMYLVTKGGELQKNKFNRINGEISGSKGTSGFSGQQASFDGKGNFYDFSIPDGQVLAFLPKRAPLVAGADGAGSTIFIQVRITGGVSQGITLKHNSGSVPNDAKHIILPNGGDINLSDRDILILVEDTEAWRLVSIIGPDKNIISLAAAYANFVTATNNSLTSISNDLNALIQSFNTEIDRLDGRIDNLSLSILEEAKELIIACNLEPNIILKGGLATSIDTINNTVEISAGVAQIGGTDIRQFPAYSGAFNVFLELHPTDASTMRWVSAPTSVEASIKYDPKTSQLLEDVVSRAAFRIGDFKMSTIYNPDDFDANGKGRWSMNGWHLMNGFNGTINMVGHIPIGFKDQPESLVDDEYKSFLGTVGSKLVQLTLGQLPRFRLSFTWKKGQADQNESGTYGSLYDADNTHNRTTYTDYIGNDQSHENRQLSRMVLYLQRVAVS
jgi:hypothetical protein